MTSTSKKYDLIMALLSLIVLAILFIEFNYTLTEAQMKLLTYIDMFILGVFSIDYSYRLAKAKDKWGFIKGNILDLVAIMPFDKAFRVARLARLVRLARLARVSRATRAIRVIVFAKKLIGNTKGILQTNGLQYILLVCSGLALLGAVGILITEPDITTFQDALWWSLVTITTVGYGDISPETLGGRLVASGLMIIGVGLMGMTTGTIATYFVGRLQNKKTTSVKDEQLEYIKTKIEMIDTLSYNDLRHLTNSIDLIWSEYHSPEKDAGEFGMS